MTTLTKRILKVFAFMLVLSGLFSVGEHAANAYEIAPTINRLGGETRISTSTKISESAYKDGADTVILVGSTGEIDALGGTLLASKLDAPIIMTHKDRLSTSTKIEIERLNPSRIIILGGESVVSQKVEEDLGAYTVERINGKNREDTVIKAAQRAMGDTIDEIFLGLGYDVYADVLAVGPVTAKLSKPVFLANKTGLSDRTMNAIQELGVKKVTIIGGETVIPVAIENVLKDMGLAVERVSGRTREETSINIAKTYFSEPSEIVIANGYVFADSVVGGYYAYKKNAPIILTRSNRLVSSTINYLSENKKDITILGLYAAVDEVVETEIATTINEPAEEPSGILKVGIYETSGNFNPLYYSSSYDGHVIDLVFEGLAALNSEGDKYEPRTAKEWMISEDSKTITFKLREDAKFSDGTPLTADDVVFTYRVLADPSYSGRYGDFVRNLAGYEEFFMGETEAFPGVVAEDASTVTFQFVEGLRSNFADTTMPILSEAHYGKEYSYGNTSSVEAVMTNPIGSGPYIVDQYIEGESISLRRSPIYIGQGYMIRDIILQVVGQFTEVDQLRNGEVDLLTGINDLFKIKEARDAGYGINEYPRSGYGYINFNAEAGPTSEVPVRQALTYAFDTETFVNAYYKDLYTGLSLATTQNHPFSKVSWAVTDALVESLNDYSYDIKKAESILDEAGWVVNGDFREKDGQVLEITIAALPEHDILATLIPMWEKSWGSALKIKLNVTFLDFSTLLDYVVYDSDANVDKWNVFFMATSITSADPDAIYTEFHSSEVGTGKDNTSRYRNSEVDRLLDEARVIMDPEKAKPLYAEVAEILNEELPKVVIYANTYRDLYNPTLQNYNASSLYSWSKAMKDARIGE